MDVTSDSECVFPETAYTVIVALWEDKTWHMCLREMDSFTPFQHVASMCQITLDFNQS